MAGGRSRLTHEQRNALLVSAEADRPAAYDALQAYYESLTPPEERERIAAYIAAQDAGK